MLRFQQFNNLKKFSKLTLKKLQNWDKTKIGYQTITNQRLNQKNLLKCNLIGLSNLK